MRTAPLLLCIGCVSVLIVHIHYSSCHSSAPHPVVFLSGVSFQSTSTTSHGPLEELLHSPYPCEQVFLDIGSNIGNHVRFLFESHLFPEAPYPAHIARHFNKHTVKNTCAVGFEANPTHWPYLDQLSKAYNRKGWTTLFLHTAVSDREGFMKFYRQGDEQDREWGFTMHDTPGSKRVSVLVPTVDIAAWMRAYIRPTHTVLVKMDIEGSEYPVMSRLLAGALSILCSSVKVITIEYHPSRAPRAFENRTVYFHDMVNRRLRRSNPTCQTVLVQMDDESYYNDTVALPI